MLEDVTLSLITERRASQPWGLAGGEPGAVGENWLLPGGDEARAERLPDKCTIQLKADDVLRMLTPGGGGWGPPPTADPNPQANVVCGADLLVAFAREVRPVDGGDPGSQILPTRRPGACSTTAPETFRSGPPRVPLGLVRSGP